jgi:LysM repeat protein
LRKLLLLFVGLLCVAVIGGIAGILLIGADYRAPDGEGRIYPGVTIRGMSVEGFTRREAVSKVTATLPVPEQTGLTISAGGQTWNMTWAAVGQAYDVTSAVDAAYLVGAEQPWWLGAYFVLRPHNVELDVPLTPADPTRVRAYVERIAERVELAPQDATLTLDGSRITGTPSREGQVLDVDQATTQVLEALAAGAPTVELATTPVLARILSPEPALSRAQALARLSFTLVVDDPLVLRSDPKGTPDAPVTPGYRAEFVADGNQIAHWLRLSQRDGAYQIDFDVMAIRAWVESVAGEIDPARLLDVDGTTARIAQTLRAGGEPRISVRVSHPSSTYTVKGGDTFFDIAYNHGFPQWHLEKANPDVDPGLIDIGQQLVIPSLDTLFPHPLIEGKRIEIDLPTQTLRAFEAEAMVFELRISSGISSTPTLQGQFQVLFKEEMAFAPRWRLDMPFFMGFYEEREGFFNGIHELPITAYGVRLSSGVLGYPASYGCIIVGRDVAQELFEWSEVGTLVRVRGVAPGTPFGRPTLLDIAPLIDDPEP